MRKTPEQYSLPLVQAAIHYAQHGWPVFPLAGKVPYKDSQGYKDATTDLEQIQSWWAVHPTANIGLPTGTLTGLIVVDIDPRHNGHMSIKELEKRYGLLPATRTARTAHGGLHRYYLHPKDGKEYPNTVKLDNLEGIDVRGDGGHVVLPPSKLFNRLSYTWGNLNLPFAPAPAWMLVLLQKEQRQKEIVPQGSRFARSPGEKWLSEAVGKATEGNRNRVGFEPACQLRDDGVPEAEARNILLTYASQVEQGKTAYTIKEALASVRSAYSRPPRERAHRSSF